MMMAIDFILAATVAFGLAGYMLAALLYPEKF